MHTLIDAYHEFVNDPSLSNASTATNNKQCHNYDDVRVCVYSVQYKVQPLNAVCLPEVTTPTLYQPKQAFLYKLSVTNM